MRRARETLFERDIDEMFMRPIQGIDLRHISNRPVARDYFFVTFSFKKVDFYRHYFQLYGHLIVCTSKLGAKPRAVMDIEHAFMKKTSDTVIDGVIHFGLKFIKRNNYEELYHSDEEVIDTWYELLKKHCVLTKFSHKFETIRVLGRGTFAKVLLVKRLVDSRQFAVKVFNKQVITQSEFERSCVINEIKVMRKMDHPRILRLHEVYESEDFFYCLCEYYRGGDLMEGIIKSGRQSEPKALTIAMQILEGLDYLHGQRVMHRDLKPDNIMFKTPLDVDLAIIDLGFAAHIDDYRTLFARCGTPGYVAPEVLHDQDYTCKVDVYSAGIILYSVLTGRIPFNGKCYSEIVHDNMMGQIDLDLEGMGIPVSTLSKIISDGSTTGNARR